MTHVVFDVGAVLVDWKPHLAWTDAFETDAEVFAFMERTGFRAKNTRADGGEIFADLAGEIDDAQDADLFSQYVERYARTVETPVHGTWDIVDQLIAQGTPLHAITNWSAETWPEGLKAQPRLGEVFQTLVISGREQITKPDRQIFDLFCTRAGIGAQDCVFVDDGLHNVEGAKQAGMDGIHFTTPARLHADLRTRGIL